MILNYEMACHSVDVSQLRGIVSTLLEPGINIVYQEIRPISKSIR